MVCKVKKLEDMALDISVASARLSKMDFTIQLDSLQIGVLWFRVFQATEQWVINRHTHSSYEFHFVASGGCRVKLDDGEFIASAGELYLTAPGVYHEQSWYGNGEYTEFSINCDITGHIEEGVETGSLIAALNNAGCRAVPDSYGGMRYFMDALKEADEQRLGYYNSIKSLVLQILISAARSLDGTGGKEYTVPHKIGGDDQRFTEIKKFITDNICTPISASDLTNHIYLSDKQVSRIIQSHTGMPTKSYINYLKMKKAKELLKDTNLTVAEITEKLGFSGEYYFSQFFKREEGYPPGVFRKNVQKIGLD